MKLPAPAPPLFAPSRLIKVRAERNLVRGWSETTRAAAALTCLIVIFLWTPLTHAGIFAAADNLQSLTLYRVAPAGYVPINTFMTDTTYDALPWLHYSAEQLHAGRLPLWNPYNSAGVPYLANIQTGIFSIFSVPFYLLRLHEALLVAAFAKLFAFGFFMYLFLRRLNLGFWPALVGASAFMFGGVHVIELSWPTTATAPMLPAALFFIADAATVPVHRHGRRVLSLVGLALSITFGVFGGHPESFIFAAGLIAAFALLEVLVASRGEGLRRFLEYMAAATGSAALAAIVLIPFLEYIRISAELSIRDTTRAKGVLAPRGFSFAAFPDLLGTPLSSAYTSTAYPVGEHYLSRNDSYIGLVTLVLAGIAIGTLPRYRNRFVPFFTLFALGTTVLVYNIGHVSTSIAQLPLLRTLLLIRSADVWLFSVAVLAAYGTQAVIVGMPRRTLFASAVAAWGLSLTAVMIIGALRFLRATAPVIQGLRKDYTPGDAAPHMIVMVTLTIFAIGSLLFAILKTTRLHLVRSVVSLCCIAAIFAQTGLLFRSFTPTVNPRYTYAVTPTYTALQQQTGDALTFGIDNAATPEDANMWYHTRHVGNYDVLGIRYYEELYNTLLPRKDWRSAASAIPHDTRDLQLLGVQYVATYSEAPFTVNASPGESDTSRRFALGILPDYPVTQMFRVSQSGFDTVGISFGTFGRPNVCTIILTLEDATTNTQITRQSRQCQEIRQGRDVQLMFTPQPDSQTHAYRLTISSPDATLQNAVAIFAAGTLGDGELRHGVTTYPDNRLQMTSFATGMPGLKRVWSDNGLNLFTVPNSLPRYYTVSHAVTVADDTTAIATMRSSAFDPTQTVLLAQASTPIADAPTTPQETITVREESPNRVRLHVVRTAPGWLVALQSYYPGWRATVNGVPTPITRANVAFRAVPVGSGESDVTFQYAPASIRIGEAISIFAWASVISVVTICIVWERRRHRTAR